jgi:hypothetical protein
MKAKIKEAIIEFIKHYEDHREGYLKPEWTPELIANVAIKQHEHKFNNIDLFSVMGRFKYNDFSAIEKIQAMCEQSLDPETFEQWENVRHWLLKTRKVIEWEFESWAEKVTGEAFIKGVDPRGNNYEGTGIMGAGEIVEVREFKKLDSEYDINDFVTELRHIKTTLIKIEEQTRKVDLFDGPG